MAREINKSDRSWHGAGLDTAALDLGSYHVPFDSLTGAQSFEAELSRAVRSGERVALVGPSGGGKSSVVASTFGPLEEGIAPIRVRVRALDDATVTTPHDFADHLIRVVADYATAADMLSADDRRALLERSGPETIRPAASRGGRLSLLPTWLISGANYLRRSDR
jgi:hypothetical protein